MCMCQAGSTSSVSAFRLLLRSFSNWGCTGWLQERVWAEDHPWKRSPVEMKFSKPGIPKLWRAHHSATRILNGLLPNAFVEVLNRAAWDKCLHTGSISKKYPYLLEVLAAPLWLYPSSSSGELPLRHLPQLAARRSGWCMKKLGLDLTPGCQGWYRGLRYVRSGRKVGRWEIFWGPR